MKGVEPLIAAVFIIIISIAGIVIVLQFTQPSVNRLNEISLFEESKKILTQIDNAVRTVSEEGEGSTRVLQLSVSGGSYFIDTSDSAVIFTMDSRSQIVGIGISQSEGNVNMFGEPNQVLLNVSYSNINITGGGSFGKGYHVLIIRNNGYDSASNKQIISVSLVAPVVPSTSIQYNQIQTLVLMGTNTTSPNNLNDPGGNYYNITEGLEYVGQHNYFQDNTQNITGFNTTSAYYTSSLDNQNYNVTSTVGQVGGTFTNQYNQTQTIVLTGTNTTSPDNLNVVDSKTYNVTEAVVTSGIVQTYNWTSPDQEAGTQRFNTSADLTNYSTGLINPQNNSILKNGGFITPANAYDNNINTRATANKSTTFATGNSSAFYNFSFRIPTSATINGIVVNYSANISATNGYIYVELYNNTRMSTTGYTTTLTTTRTNYTQGSASNLWGDSWSPAIINNMSINTTMYGNTNTKSQWLWEIWANVYYTNHTSEKNSSWVAYSNIGGSNYTGVDKVGAIVTINTYNPAGSNNTYNNNIRPDIEIGFYNGTAYVNGSYCYANNTMGMNLKNTTAWNCSINTTNSDILNAWKYTTNRSVIIHGIWLDAYNSTILDEINVTGIYGYVDGWSTTTPTYRAEIEHNATGISWSEVLNSINVSLNFTTNVTSNFSLTIYNSNSGNWNYTACQNGTVAAGSWYNWWCNITSNPSYYNSSDEKIRVRLNETAHSGVALVREDYVQYYVTYTTTPKYANISVEHNSSSISENPSLITKINVTTIMKTNISSGIPFNFYIYNFNSLIWEPCAQTLFGILYNKMECVRTTNPSYYISNGKISVRLNSSGNTLTHQMMEDYLVYQITTPSQYGIEVEHNATGVSWLNSLINISVLLNFSKTSIDNPTFNFMIYNFNSGNWESCDAFTPPDNNWYSRWCNEIINPENYVGGGVIRVRLNETAHQNQADVREDYVQYYVTYTR